MEAVNFVLNVLNILFIWILLLNRALKYYEFKVDGKHLEIWKFKKPVGDVPNIGRCLIRLRVFII